LCLHLADVGFDRFGKRKGVRRLIGTHALLLSARFDGVDQFTFLPQMKGKLSDQELEATGCFGKICASKLSRLGAVDIPHYVGASFDARPSPAGYTSAAGYV
jgi:hypothetical protein